MSIKLDRTFGLLESSLDGSIARQKAIAHNVSNIDTPGFKRFLVNFEDQMENSRGKDQQLPLQITEPKHISSSANENFDVARDLSTGLRADGNNVDLENEMTLMVKNDVYFNAALNQVNKKIAMLKFAIDGK